MEDMVLLPQLRELVRQGSILLLQALLVLQLPIQPSLNGANRRLAATIPPPHPQGLRQRGSPGPPGGGR